MKKILVPTDFSERAKDAYIYARELAEKFDASIKVVHVYHPSGDLINPYGVSQIPELEEIKKDAMIQFVSHGFSNTIVDVITAEQIEHEIIIGFPIEKIVDMSKDDYDFDRKTNGEYFFENLPVGTLSSIVSS